MRARVILIACCRYDENHRVHNNALRLLLTIIGTRFNTVVVVLSSYDVTSVVVSAPIGEIDPAILDTIQVSDSTSKWEELLQVSTKHNFFTE